VLAASTPFPSAHTLTGLFSQAARARRVTILLIATALLCLGDLALTMTYVTSMGMVESNPIARAVMTDHSPSFVVLWKLASMALGLGILFYARRTKGAEIAAWLCFLVMGALTIHWFCFAATVAHLPFEYVDMASADDPRWVNMAK
jgi:hypothetical protein